MNRRSLLKLLSTGVIGHTLDIDRLLWVPGQRTIFLPSLHRLTTSEIVALEIERILPHLRVLFERDDTFYKLIETHEKTKISSRDMRIPLEKK